MNISHVTNSAEKELVIRQCENNGEIWVLVLNNPPVNVLTEIVFQKLDGEVEAFERDSKSKILILTGTGERAFSAGVAIDEIIKTESVEKLVLLAKRGQQFCDRLEKMDKPVIAAINALCLGGGNEVALACHFRLASENAKFGQPEINMGFIPGFGGTQRLSRLVGISRARKMILTGETIDAKEAFRIGLVDMILAKGKFLNDVFAFANRIAGKGQVSIRVAQRALREGHSKSLKEGMALELECFKETCETEDMKEGLKAFVEKRKPNFRDK